jgi:hypothetical protein
MKVNKYFPFALIYFFVNSLALPFGLTYTALLAPLFYIWILRIRKKEVLLPFLAVLFPFIIIHLMIVGVDTKSYFLSLLNFILVYVFCQAVYTFLIVCKEPEKIFRSILVLNFIFCLAAVPFYFTPYFEPLWIEQNIAMNVGHFRRLQLFTYEPSYYALLFTPFFFFYLLQYCFSKNSISANWLLLMLFLPYILSFSIGVIGAVILSGLSVWIIYFRRLTRKKRILNALIYTGTGFISAMLVLILFFRQNPVFTRIRNILSGEDSSGNGRITDAFILASKLLQKKNEYWGVGIGQIKIMGEAIIRNYYLYSTEFRVAIPNAVAETLAIFGWVGVSLRLGIEIFLFFHTRVWTNYYRLLLFLFIFIYQFTGSFITNAAEYVIWIFAFTRVFQQFDIKAAKE